VGLRAKFNLVLLGIAVVGAALFFVAAGPLVDAIAKEDVLQSSRIMMESAAGARKYTSEQIAPVLKPMIATHFYPQSVSAYAAKRNFDVIHAKFPDFSYREAALNPTNPQDRAVDWEADIINDFRAHPDKPELVMVRATATGPVLDLARPLVNGAECMSCHSTAQAAPKSMLALYGPQNGFGWRLNEVIGAQIVSVPMAVPRGRADQARNLFLLIFVGVFGVMLALLNVALGMIVIRPVDRIARAAEAVSMGEADTPEFHWRGSDEIARLAASVNRMRRSLQEALRMLDER
jgi:protein-histidine pros-kinase